MSKKDISELYAGLDEITRHIHAAIEAAHKTESLAKSFGGEINRCVAGQLSAYLIATLDAFIHDENQAGSIADLCSFLNDFEEERK